MRGPDTPRDSDKPWRGEEIAAPETRREHRRETTDDGAERQRETQPLPAGRPLEAGEVASVPQGHDAAATPATSISQFFSERDTGVFRQRWLQVQSGFVDQPREAVQEADNLLGDVLDRLSHGLASERDGLASRWRGGSGGADTEDLRLALQGYRSLLDRLLGS
jgi:hypothetical protein